MKSAITFLVYCLVLNIEILMLYIIFHRDSD